MADGKGGRSLLLRVYAIAATAGWFGGGFAFMRSMTGSGAVHPLVLVVIACSLPVIPLVIYRGSGVFGPAFENLIPGRRKPEHRIIGLALAGFLAAGFLFGAWAFNQERIGRNRIRAFAARAGKDAVVTCDGAVFPHGTELIERLAELGTVPGHHSHAGRRFPVIIRSGGESLEMEFGRDSQRPDEYWVFLPEDWFTDYNDVGRLTTPLLVGIPSSGSSRPRRERR